MMKTTSLNINFCNVANFRVGFGHREKSVTKAKARRHDWAKEIQRNQAQPGETRRNQTNLDGTRRNQTIPSGRRRQKHGDTKRNQTCRIQVKLGEKAKLDETGSVPKVSELGGPSCVRSGTCISCSGCSPRRLQLKPIDALLHHTAELCGLSS